jgi:thymidylate synthase ThyX
MIKVEPKVFLIAYTEIDNDAVAAWLEHVGGLKVLDHLAGDEGERLVELAGRNCYRSFDVGLNPNISKVRTDSEEYHKNILDSAHGSVMEHATATFAFEDVSRVFCYSDDTEVLTDEGWKKWPEVTGKEKFATLNRGSSRRDPVDRIIPELIFERPSEHFVKDYDGKMYSVESEQISLLVTPNHRMWIQKVDTQAAKRGEEKFDIRLAGSILNKRVRYQKGNVSWHGKRMEQIEISGTDRSYNRKDTGTETTKTYKGRSFDSEVFARFLGYFLSEGSLGTHDTGINLYQNPGKVYEHMIEVLNGMNLPVTDTVSGYADSRRLCVKCVALYDWLDEHCGRGALHKKIPDLVKSWSSDLIDIFLESFIEGDGNIHRTNHHKVAYTNSKQLADGLQELALKTGVAANIRIDDRVGTARRLKSGQIFTNTNPGYIVSFLMPSRMYPHVNHALSESQYKRSNGYMDEMVHYKGKVYCVKVPSGLLYVRRNGKPCWSGNTHEAVRHRAGTAMSQESLRYVRLDNLKFWIPEIIAENEEAFRVFRQVVETCEWGQRRLAEIFDMCNIKSFHIKKQLTSAFRRVAPIGLATALTMTFNLRSLRWVIQMRTAASAEVEIRKVFCKVYEIARGKWSFLFQDFETLNTGDGLFEAKPGNLKV